MANDTLHKIGHRFPIIWTMLIAVLSLCVVPVADAEAADRDSPVGVYHSRGGMYAITLTLLANGNYLARWDGDIGTNGSATGSWEQAGEEIRLRPKREDGPFMPGYLRVLLIREMEKTKALIRKEDVKNQNNPLFFLYLEKRHG
jgi:hypothetical protein